MPRFKAVRKIAADITPNAFTFTDVTGVATLTTETSNTITVAGLGIGVSVSASVSGDASSQLQKNGGSWITSTTVVNGDTIAVRHTSSGSNSTAVNTVLTIGGVSDTYTSTTAAAGAAAPFYDSRYGTDAVTAASTGWLTFGLKAGCRRVWVNSSGGSDGDNDGLSAATAKATLDAAVAVYHNGSFLPGDQLMIAGTGGRIYTDGGTVDSMNNGGFSATYPCAFLSYDPAAPADSTKYGRLVGPDMPSVKIATGGTSVIFNMNGNDNGAHFLAIQGIEIDAANKPNVGLNYVGRHDGIIYQNCRLLFSEWAMDAYHSSSFSQGAHMSKCSVVGPWEPGGNAACVFGAGVTDWYVQDVVFIHGGWRIGAIRDDAFADGGTSSLGHSVYYHAGQEGGRFDRVVYMQSAADGYGIRGSATLTQLTSWDEPIVGFMSGFTGSYTEQPLGSLTTVDDFVTAGGDDLNTANPRGGGIAGSNSRTGSYVKNGVMIDNPKYGTGVSLNQVFSLQVADQTTPAQIDQHVDIDGIRCWNFSPTPQYIYYNDGGANTPTSKASLAWSNCILDALGTYQPVTGTNISTWTSGTYPDPIDRATILTRLGFTGASYNQQRDAFANMMAYRPDIPWSQIVHGVVMPAFGATPQYQTATLPDLTGIVPPVIYDSTTSAPTLSSPVGTATGTTTATIGATTDQANGKIWYVVTTSATPPSRGQIRSGLNNSGTAAVKAGTITVSSTGAKTASITGLTTATAYHAYFMHENSTWKWSAASSSSTFTTS